MYEQVLKRYGSFAFGLWQVYCGTTELGFIVATGDRRRLPIITTGQPLPRSSVKAAQRQMHVDQS
jgi:hypothetical protein